MMFEVKRQLRCYPVPWGQLADRYQVLCENLSHIGDVLCSIEHELEEVSDDEGYIKIADDNLDQSLYIDTTLSLIHI